MKQKNTFLGFTIIETSLVLAIGGLIFLMVFIALPALQRQTRDTERKEDLSSLISAIKKFQTNNRGALPSGTDWNSDDALKPYLDSDFIDPNGTKYDLGTVSECTSKIGEKCNSGDLSEVSFPNDYKVVIVKSATCSGEAAVKTANKRKVAVLYKLEGGGIYCNNT